MAEIRAIQTFYNGTYFRSRIEARWAVFFDVLGVKYEYEPDKFELKSSRYIPDFRIDDLVGCGGLLKYPRFFEIKAGQPTAYEWERFDQFCDVIETGPRSFGTIQDDVFMVHGSIRDHKISAYDKTLKWFWFQCPFCGCLSLEWNHPSRSFMSTTSCEERHAVLREFDIEDYYFGDTLDYSASPAIEIAMSCAQSARFEDPQFLNAVSSQKQAVMALFSSRVFSHPKFWNDLTAACKELRNNPNCPHFEELELV